jgi:hypothetical protein
VDAPVFQILKGVGIMENIKNMTPEQLAEHYFITENTDDFESTGIGDETELTTATDERGAKN